MNTTTTPATLSPAATLAASTADWGVYGERVVEVLTRYLEWGLIRRDESFEEDSWVLEQARREADDAP